LIRAHYANHINNATFRRLFSHGGLAGHVDLPRLKAGMSGGAFWSAFWPCP
jgi:membrane dipeptidase